MNEIVTRHTLRFFDRAAEMLTAAKGECAAGDLAASEAKARAAIAYTNWALANIIQERGL